ncbi:MAG: hypothetical protein FWD58_10565, partial [Firmicutes bacterium]|nr:hypothetical protein [Bacillota bacterium]
MSEQFMRKQPKKEELRKKLCGLISHDPIMQRCVLNEHVGDLKDEDEFSGKFFTPYVPLGWIGNLAALAAAFLFCKFNKWRKEVGSNTSGPAIPNALYLKRLLAGLSDADDCFDKPSAALRVLRMLDGLYGNFGMDFYAISHLIVKSQIEAGYNLRVGGLTKLIGFPHEESFLLSCSPEKSFTFPEKSRNLAAAFNLVSRCRGDKNLVRSMQVSYNSETVALAFEDVLDALSFLSRIKLDVDGQGVVSFFEGTADFLDNPDQQVESIPSHGVVRIFEAVKCAQPVQNNDKAGDSYGAIDKIDANEKSKEQKEDRKKTYKVYASGNQLPREFCIEFFLLERVDFVRESDKERFGREANEDSLNSAVEFTYRTFNEAETVSAYFVEKGSFKIKNCLEIPPERSAAEHYKKICGYLPGTRTSSTLFQTTQYRYYNPLAASIADAIDDYDDECRAKCRVLDTYVKENGDAAYKELLDPAIKTLDNALCWNLGNEWGQRVEKLRDYLAETDNYGKRVIDWDTLLTLVLIDRGPTEVIRALLSHESHGVPDIEKICASIIAGLAMRYVDKEIESPAPQADNEVESPALVKENFIFDPRKVAQDQDAIYKKNFKEKVDGFKKIFPGSPSKKIECKALTQSYIDAMFKSLVRIEKSAAEKKSDAESKKFAKYGIYHSIAVLAMAQEDTELASMRRNADKAFIHAVTAFLSFYAGMKNSFLAKMSYEFEKNANILSADEIEKSRRNIEKEFLLGVSRKASELNRLFKEADEIKADAVQKAFRALWALADLSYLDARYCHAMLARPPINRVQLEKIFCVDQKDKLIFVSAVEGRGNIGFEELEKSKLTVHIMLETLRFLAG